MQTRKAQYLKGMKDGIPIGLGYFAVSITLGIVAKEAGFSPLQAMLTSFLINASAGEFVGFTLIAANCGYLELIIMEAVANIRYLLMSCSLSQKLPPETSMLHRMLIGFDVTDEIFGVSIGVPGYLNPFYTYGVILAALPGWCGGTALGVLMGNLLPSRLVSALSVGLYGMFLAVIIPPARKEKLIRVLVAASMGLSFLADRLLPMISSGTRVILLTVAISAVAAIFFPIKEDAPAQAEAEGGAV